MTRTLPAFCAITIMGLAAGFLVMPEALAQSVPLPKPAPKQKQITVAQARGPRAPPAVIRAPADRAARGNRHHGEATAFDNSQRALVDKISTYLTGMRTMVGKFVQVGPDGRKTKGDLFVQKPGKLAFRI